MKKWFPFKHSELYKSLKDSLEIDTEEENSQPEIPNQKSKSVVGRKGKLADSGD